MKCATGYTISKDQKQCIKCSIKNCFECSNDGKSCNRCKAGLVFDPKTKTCVACKVANCDTCVNNFSTCTKCIYDVATGIPYGLMGNTCVSCLQYDKNANQCENGKVTGCTVGSFVDKARNACTACTFPCTDCEGSSTYCTFCDLGYQDKPVNGKCISKGGLESEAQALATNTTESAAAYTIVMQHVLGTLALIFMMW